MFVLKNCLVILSLHSLIYEVRWSPSSDQLTAEDIWLGLPDSILSGESTMATELLWSFFSSTLLALRFLVWLRLVKLLQWLQIKIFEWKYELAQILSFYFNCISPPHVYITSLRVIQPSNANTLDKNSLNHQTWHIVTTQSQTASPFEHLHSKLAPKPTQWECQEWPFRVRIDILQTYD